MSAHPLGEDITSRLDKLAEAIFSSVGSKPEKRLIQKYVDTARSITKEQAIVLRHCARPKSNREIQEDALSLKFHTDNFKRYIEPLLGQGLLGRTIPHKPKSPQQKYFVTERGKVCLYIISLDEGSAIS